MWHKDAPCVSNPRCVLDEESVVVGMRWSRIESGEASSSRSLSQLEGSQVLSTQGHDAKAQQNTVRGGLVRARGKGGGGKDGPVCRGRSVGDGNTGLAFGGQAAVVQLSSQACESVNPEPLV